MHPSDVLKQMQVLVCEQVPLKDVRTLCRAVECVSHSPLECSAPPVPPDTKVQIVVQFVGRCPSMVLSRSPCAMARFLVPLVQTLCHHGCAIMDVPPWSDWTTCAA